VVDLIGWCGRVAAAASATHIRILSRSAEAAALAIAVGVMANEGPPQPADA